MRIMSFNTQHCEVYKKDKIDFEFFAEAICGLGTDIIGLQEMRGDGIHPDYTDQVGTLARLCGMEHHYFAKAIDVGGCNPYGNGLLSKIPIMSAENIIIPDPVFKVEGRYYETRCILKAKLENGFTVLVTHFGLTAEERENAVKCVMENLENEKCILMGDFNALPYDEVLLPIRERMTDTADFFDKPKFSYPSDVPDRKIDYIFVSKDIKVISADIPSVIVSDHRPYICEVKE